LYLNFQQGWVNIREVMHVFRNGINLRILNFVIKTFKIIKINIYLLDKV